MRQLSCLLVLVCFAGSAVGAEWLVDRDGSGDFITLGEAVEAAAHGDVVRLEAGHYYEFVEVDKSLVIEAVAGADVVLDGGFGSRIMNVTGPVFVTLRDLVYANALGNGPSALMIWNGADVAVERCVFRNNYTYGSDTVHVRHLGTRVRFEDCDFIGNVVSQQTGALGIAYDSQVTVSRCRFIENRAGASGYASGAVAVYQAVADITDSVFLRNANPDGVGALNFNQSAGNIERCTFRQNVGNQGTASLAGVRFEQNIVAGTQFGVGVNLRGNVFHRRNLYFNNDSGPGVNLDGEDVTLPPEFCDLGTDDLSLCDSSPALAVNNGIADMGAYGAGCASCAPTANEDRTWGAVKSLYR